jgi:iron complex transport system substrate-binding protein
MASLIMILAGPDKLVAVAPEALKNPWLRRIMPGAANLSAAFSHANAVNLETLLAVKPDFVTLWLGNEPLGKRLERAGIPVLYLGYTTPEEMKTAVRTLGQALGPQERAKAEDFVRYYEDNLRRVATALSDLPEAAKPRVYYAATDPLRTEGSKSMVDVWINLAGGINVAARSGLQGVGQVHQEDVLAWNPEIIVTMNAAQRQAILEDFRWKGISAVRNGRVFVNPHGVNNWCTRAAEASLQVLWAAQTFHPERFSQIDMGLETHRFYQRFYGLDLDADELSHILRGEALAAP